MVTLGQHSDDEQVCRDYIGGYGVDAKLLYDQMPAHADPPGPDNVLGFLTGPLTGTPALIGFALGRVRQVAQDRRLGGCQLRRLDEQGLRQPSLGQRRKRRGRVDADRRSAGGRRAGVRRR